MVLTRSYKDTVVKRIQDDPEFAAALYAEALSALVDGDRRTALSILRDLVHARVTFKKLSRETGLGEKSLHRILGARGNPTLENLTTILQHVGKALGLRASVVVEPAGGKSRRRRRRTDLAVA
jgi:DNA-binding phage protein